MKKRLTTISESLKISESGDHSASVPLAQLNSVEFWKIKTEDDYLDWWAKEMGMSVEELIEAEPTIEEVAKKAVQIIQNSKMLTGSEALPIQIPTIEADKYDSIYVGDDGSQVWVIATNLKHFEEFVE